ncbi:MAG: ABC transporter permease subunit [Clostridiales bacterium]|nr:ABC transporter permease subunit [Clostridiales bacterium]
MSALKRIFEWIKRAFTGKKNLPTTPLVNESPSRLLRETFFAKKTAMVALILVIGLFAFVFIAPLFVRLDINYTDPLQQNVAPIYTLKKVPRALKKSVSDIDGFSEFTVGISKDGKVFVWGDTKDRLSGRDYKRLPTAVERDGAAKIAAGKDHILALTNGGELVGWGDSSCGQYGFLPTLNAITTPIELADSIPPQSVKQLACGYQSSALVKTDGSAYFWGNKNTTRNLDKLAYLTGVEKAAFTNSAAIALQTDGSITTGEEEIFTVAVSSRTGTHEGFYEYIKGKSAVDIATTNKCLAVLFDDGELVVSGVFENGEEQLPTLKNGEYFVSITGGTRHFAGVTNLGNAYAWGHNAYGQCDLKKDGKTAAVYTGALQTYAVDKDGKVLQSVGLKGYIMGTDGRGRDIFARIVHGGKMTMTIGAVAVLVSSAIAILVGCVSGYFGGAVDTFLMRVTEIFSSVPFLPFAMLLSQIIKYYNLAETTRIFIIMLILGVLSWTGLARMIRGQVLAEREKEFVLAARAIGVKERKIAFRHILPNIVSVILVSMTLDFAGCLLTESSLSYLGFGVQQPQPTWGNMLNGCNNSTIIQNYWWQWLFPSLFLSLATICINIVGDALRDALDPKR